MLKSLFGELYPARDTSRSSPAEPFATPEFEASQPALNDSGWQPTQPPRRAERVEATLSVGLPLLDSLRIQMGRQRDTTWDGQGVIAMVDPMRMWAPAVLKAMADTAGQFVDRLHVQDRATAAEIALVESTPVLRRAHEAVLVCHAQADDEVVADTVNQVLMECADLTVFVVPTLADGWMEAQEQRLRDACALPQWGCSEVLFLLPPAAHEVADRIDRGPWPPGVRVRSVREPLTSTGAVWSALVTHWNRVQPRRTPVSPKEALFRPPNDPPVTSGFGALPALHELPINSGAMPLFPMGGSIPRSASQPVPLATLVPATPPADRVKAALGTLSQVDGLLFVALVDVRRVVLLSAAGDVLSPEDAEAMPYRVAKVVSAHRGSLKAFGHSRSVKVVEEILVTAGDRYHILRGLPSYPDCYVLGVADKLRSNLAMTRFRILEAQKALA